jgi:Ni/Co efflux regulator RcnB
LRQPSRGHQWVQMGGDYVLIAIASGVIAQLLINH